MSPDDSLDTGSNVQPSDDLADCGGPSDDGTEIFEAHGNLGVIAQLNDHVQLIAYENNTMAIVGSEEWIKSQLQSGLAYYYQLDDVRTVALVPGDSISNEDEPLVVRPDFIPIVVGTGDGSSFGIVDYTGTVNIQVGMAQRASLNDGTIVYGSIGNAIGPLHESPLYRFDFAPTLQSHPSGAHFVRGPAEKIIENELVNVFTHDGRPLVVIPRERFTKERDGTVIYRVDMEAYNNELTEFRSNARRFADANNTFIFFYSGPINDQGFNKLVRACVQAQGEIPATKERTRVLLVLVTQGGDPNAAYRCARYLWHQFRGYQILIPGSCKSAGTLLAMGADEIYISRFGELGPIDLQIFESDADYMDSSATLIATLDAIRENSFKTFNQYMNDLGTHPSMTLQTRSEISAKLTNEIHASISGKIDPRELGRMHRHLKLCYEYGIRLAARAKNISEEGVRRLVYDYPQHGFVIDRYEAAQLFPNVISEGLEGFDEILQLISPLSWRLRYLYMEDQIVETIATPQRTV